MKVNFRLRNGISKLRTAGQLVYKGEEKRIMLPKNGLYLVKIGNQTVKVVM